MKINRKGFKVNLYVEKNKGNGWTLSEDHCIELGKEQGGIIPFVLRAEEDEETEIRLVLDPEEGGKEVFHLIPCCILGDNNAAQVHEGEFPLLADTQNEKDIFQSAYWEFRADRAAMPFSALCTEYGTIAAAIDPYTFVTADQEERFVPNGLFAGLPDQCGVTLGYMNAPFTYVNRRTPEEARHEWVAKGAVQGRIYILPAKDMRDAKRKIADIIRNEYSIRHERADFKKSAKDAVLGCIRSVTTISWNSETKEYTNCNCLPPENTILKPWRDVKEIGWTGGGVLAYPLILAQDILGETGEKMIEGARSGYEMFDQIAASFNEKSGLINDLTGTIDESGSLVNGWWTYFGLVKDVHSAYNVGSAVHYMLKSIVYLKKNGRKYPEKWMEVCKKTLDTVVKLQRADGAYGYTYRTDRQEVVDWEGFAGCWFMPCLAYLYHLTGERKYLRSADKALTYYGKAVRDLTCCGTPMDTWKSPDQEGNLAFIRGARLLHEFTGEEKYLDALQAGADYECLWRYGYRTRPLYKPLINGWNACGGSITSVSNPHIHPMGMIVDTDLLYLGKVTGEQYYEDRALDGYAWIMQTLELYPEQTGYGRYGVLSERWCPSDGLVIQKDSEGNPYSSWYSYNLWAAAAALEEVCERALDMT